MKIAILMQYYFVHKYLWPVYFRIKEEILNFQEVTTNVYLSSGANFNVIWIRNSVNIIVFNTENKKKDMKNSVKQSQKMRLCFWQIENTVVHGTFYLKPQSNVKADALSLLLT